MRVPSRVRVLQWRNKVDMADTTDKAVKETKVFEVDTAVMGDND